MHPFQLVFVLGSVRPTDLNVKRLFLVIVVNLVRTVLVVLQVQIGMILNLELLLQYLAALVLC